MGSRLYLARWARPARRRPRARIRAAITAARGNLALQASCGTRWPVDLTRGRRPPGSAAPCRAVAQSTPSEGNNPPLNRHSAGAARGPFCGCGAPLRRCAPDGRRGESRFGGGGGEIRRGTPGSGTQAKPVLRPTGSRRGGFPARQNTRYTTAERVSVARRSRRRRRDQSRRSCRSTRRCPRHAPTCRQSAGPGAYGHERAHSHGGSLPVVPGLLGRGAARLPRQLPAPSPSTTRGNGSSRGHREIAAPVDEAAKDGWTVIKTCRSAAPRIDPRSDAPWYIDHRYYLVFFFLGETGGSGAGHRRQHLGRQLLRGVRCAGSVALSRSAPDVDHRRGDHHQTASSGRSGGQRDPARQACCRPELAGPSRPPPGRRAAIPAFGWRAARASWTTGSR